MRRFLLVGCGGSGGVTLQFVMDQLRADLALTGVDALPDGWQFVHVDVPVKPDGVGRGMPPTVPDQGGRYVGFAHPGATYPGVAQNIEGKLRTSGQLGQLATWRPNPEQVGIPIADGAGQQRAIGRMLTLTKASLALEQLEAAFAALNGVGVGSELGQIADRVSPATKQQIDAPPVVLVVSSMAGGAGASMVLDVCRLLAQANGHDPRATALFLYTPEVFGSLPQHARGGIDGNALAMTGELLAAQAGAGTAGDEAVLRALGLPAAHRAKAPFGRVIPVGAKVGASGAPFGDGSAVGVYRGLGRGIAALMMSGRATQQFISYDIVNPVVVPTKQETLGWGLDTNALLWGSFGFASVGLGRERYAEYAAQRLARSAVDRLVGGHLQARDQSPAIDQLRRLNDNRYPYFAEEAGLPTRDVREWFVPLLQKADLSRAAGEVVEGVMGRRLQLAQPVDLRQWLPVVMNEVAQDGQRLREGIDRVAAGWAFDWVFAPASGLVARLEDGLSQVVVDFGLAAGRDMIDRVYRDADGWVQALQNAAKSAPLQPQVLPADVRQKVESVRGLIDANHAAIGLIRTGFTENVLAAIRARCAELAADILRAVRSDLLTPMADACGDALQLLTAARSSHAKADVGLARLHTDDYASWPTNDTEMPRRFTEAHNELLLTKASEFPERFTLDVKASVGRMAESDGEQSETDAIADIVAAVIRGRWTTTGEQPRTRLITPDPEFWPGVFPTHRATGQVRPPQVARYRIAVRADEILERGRRWVQRPNEPFDRFIGQSLRDYLSDRGANDAERDGRAREVRDRFHEALALARPLVAVNSGIVESIHGSAVQTSYKFSDIPFGGFPLAGQLRDDLAERSEIEATSVGRFEEVLRSDSTAKRIDIFGSYGRLSPVTFSSLLGPLNRHWAASVTVESRNEFFRLRRARRLPGCLPMGDSHRRAAIGGWFVARLTGRLRLPSEHPGEAVEVWDEDQQRWVGFPQPLIIDREDFRRPADVMPTVMLSSLIALAASCQYPDLDPLRPYTVLRLYWDDTVHGRPEHDDPSLLTAARSLGDWLRTGRQPYGSPAVRPGSPPPPVDPDGRRTELLTSLETLHQQVGKEYLPPGHLGASGGGTFAHLDRSEALVRVPLYHELAADIYTVLGRMLEIVANVNLHGDSGGAPYIDEALG
jgi:tubulin-like protein